MIEKLLCFPDEPSRQRWLRIMVSAAAYGYEFKSESFLDDATFDALCKLIQPFVQTGRPDLDWFFMTEFSPDTGQWIHKHPELEKVKTTFEKVSELWKQKA